MSQKYSQFKQRVLSALVAIPVVVTAICWHPWSYFLLFLVIVVVSMLEFYKLALHSGVHPNKAWGITSGILIYTLVFMYASGHMAASYLSVLGPVIALTYPIELYRKSVVPFTNIAYTLLGMIYVSIPFALLHLIAFAQGTYRHEVVMGILLILWASDTGAYLVGSSIGKHKLFERISPKKTWEGSLGGVVFALLMGYSLAHYWSVISLEAWLCMSGIIVVAGTYGDLVESMLKRSLNIKDSGGIIPGHGGLLDRFDSFLLAMPFILALIKLLP